jgi:tetratricopeptide (TPR) repeat protein
MSELAERYATLARTIEEIGTTLHQAGKLQQAGIILGVGSALAFMPQMPEREGMRLSLAFGRHLAQAAFQTNSGFEQAYEALLTAQQRALDLGDVRSAAEARNLTGIALYYQALHGGPASYEDARAQLGEALREREALGDACDIAESQFWVGLIAERLGEERDGRTVAREWYERALQLATEHGCKLVQRYTYRHLAGLAEEGGDLDAALSHFEQSLRLTEEEGEQVLLPLAHMAVGDVLAARGDAQGAAQHYVRALELAREQEAPLSLIHALLAVGSVFQARGDPDQARAHYEEALGVAQANSLGLALPEIGARMAELSDQA